MRAPDSTTDRARPTALPMHTSWRTTSEASDASGCPLLGAPASSAAQGSRAPHTAHPGAPRAASTAPHAQPAQAVTHWLNVHPRTRNPPPRSSQGGAVLNPARRRAGRRRERGCAGGRAAHRLQLREGLLLAAAGPAGVARVDLQVGLVARYDHLLRVDDDDVRAHVHARLVRRHRLAAARSRPRVTNAEDRARHARTAAQVWSNERRAHARAQAVMLLRQLYPRPQLPRFSQPRCYNHSRAAPARKAKRHNYCLWIVTGAASASRGTPPAVRAGSALHSRAERATPQGLQARSAPDVHRHHGGQAAERLPLRVDQVPGLYERVCVSAGWVVRAVPQVRPHAGGRRRRRRVHLRRFHSCRCAHKQRSTGQQAPAQPLKQSAGETCQAKRSVCSRVRYADLPAQRT